MIAIHFDAADPVPSITLAAGRKTDHHELVIVCLELLVWIICLGEAIEVSMLNAEECY